MMSVRQMEKVSRQFRGFSLIEVLIALIIMSVGMLGIAGLYVHGMQAGRTSTFRHHAVMLAGDVADRIRANPLGRADYEGAGANNNCVGGGINCTAAEMAANDVDLWLQQAAATLPDGDIDVTYAPGVPAQYTVTVSWSEPGQDVPPPQYAISFPIFEML
ncbi:MAG TPA: type IV pilus modification protein PilV [Woeseiaceae bacterium]|nr:type IV pilus modification protein PilV [Woeseiaceae bacterium]